MTKQAMFVKLTPSERAEREHALTELDLEIVRLDREKRQWSEEHKEVRKPIESRRLEICQELESGQRWVDPQIAMPFSGKVEGVRFEFGEDESDPDDRPELQTQKRKRGRKAAQAEAVE